MTQTERRLYLIRALLAEQPRYRRIAIPEEVSEQRRLLRSLMNVRPPQALSDSLLEVQDEYLREELDRRGVAELAGLSPVEEGIYLWQGDITTLRCDAIVNAANSGLTGCYVPCHQCIDNCNHICAGIQLRQACASLIDEQGHEEETGRAKITRAYNLPCRYVLHTVGPIIDGPLTGEDEDLLASCYRSCLELAQAHGVRSIAFCCISTGVFRFPRDRAAEIAVRTVREFRARAGGGIQVIFNVFKDVDYEIYRALFAAD